MYDTLYKKAIRMIIAIIVCFCLFYAPPMLISNVHGGHRKPPKKLWDEI